MSNNSGYIDPIQEQGSEPEEATKDDGNSTSSSHPLVLDIPQFGSDPCDETQGIEGPSNSLVEPRSPTSLENFNLGQVLGEGGFGRVFLAQNKNTKQLCAIKALEKAQILEKGNLNSVFKEKEILQRISHAAHPFLITLHGTFQTDSHLFYAMEHLPGGDMCDFLNHVELQEPDVMFYTACVVLGLEALHQIGIVHRDLKLENLLLDQEGYLKIVDFGLSKDRFGYSDRTNTMCGTRTYMAPEIYMKIGYGMAADWWALGVTVYIMLMYELPFNDEDPIELMKSIRYDEIELPEDLSEDVSNFIYQLLEKDPEYRLGSGEAGAEMIKEHPFFRDMDWEQLLHRKIRPPFVLNHQGHLESLNDPECQAPALTPLAVAVAHVRRSKEEDIEDGLYLYPAQKKSEKYETERRQPMEILFSDDYHGLCSIPNLLVMFI
ncbi:serine/threonine-protein kinase N1-like [Xenopus laevis]|uniref:non-specific serine/threonine protein kinase n=1 Tax=Xenopus laevis TaxID=8355 RepID=A0A8J1M7Y0_XENLA|nr:serine/threonine-protein kinase N1-like [Xenopus laevis]